jgi:2-iminobutanoate/2-iminopropanoate deaminase
MVGADPATGQLVGTDVGTQTRQVLANLTAVLETAGMDLSNVVKATVHLADMRDFAAFDAVYRSVMPAPYPVRTTVGSTMLGVLVEIDFVAYRDPNG